MQREFKFRMWDNLKKSWVVKKVYHAGLNFDESGIGVFDFKQHPEGVTMQQYTGLKDKNGREICEGDIIQLNGAPYKYSIEFVDEYWAINDHGKLGYDDYDLQPLNNCVYDRAEIIGNIFENPELIK